MGWSYRKSKKIGPFRITASRRGLSASGGGRDGGAAGTARPLAAVEGG